MPAMGGSTSMPSSPPPTAAASSLVISPSPSRSMSWKVARERRLLASLFLVVGCQQNIWR